MAVRQNNALLSCYDGGRRVGVFYAIEEQDAEWVIYVHGVAILRCAQSDVALEAVRSALQMLVGDDTDQARLGETLPPMRLRESGA